MQCTAVFVLSLVFSKYFIVLKNNFRVKHLPHQLEKKPFKTIIEHLCMIQQLGSEVERQGKTNKSTIPRIVLSFQRKEEEFPLVGFEPTTLCSLSERSTN